MRTWAVIATAAVAASIVGVAPAGAAEPDAAIDELIVETPFWSGVVADSLLQAQDLDANPYAVLVHFRDDAAADDAVALLATVEGRLVGVHRIEADGPEIHVVETRVGLDHALATLRASSLVIAAEPDDVVEADAVSNDTYAGLQWGLEDDAGIDVAPAWAAAAGAATVVVGVVDSGVDRDHADLDGVMWVNDAEIAGNGIDDDANGYVDDVHGWDFADWDADPTDPNGHGTHVAGTIAAEIGNAAGVAGVAPNVEIMALRFLNSQGKGFTSDAIAALGYALDQGVEITNNSWGGGSFNWTLDALIAGAPDHLFVVAAGNSSLDVDATPVYPAAYAAPNLLTVASHTSSASASSFSNTGLESVDLSAPGSSIVSTVPGSYGYASGTSMAAPHVAGVAAIVKGIDPSLSPADIIGLLLDTTRWQHESIIDATASGGHLDAARAAAAADPAAPDVAIATPATTVVEGDTIDLSAAATGGAGDLSDDIVWYVESADGSFDGSSIGTGATASFVAGEAGRIRVRAEVTDGDGRWSVDTVLLDAMAATPSAPIDVGVVPGERSLAVSWSAPAFVGGSPIVGYVATAEPGGATCASTDMSCVIEDLDTDLEYTVAVVAANDAGVGEPSAPVGPFSPAVVPGAPASISATAGDHRIVVSWTAPSDDGGAPVESYVVTLVPGGVVCVVDDLGCVVGDLENGVSHEVSVAAVNAAGTGAAASVLNVTPTPASGSCDGHGSGSSFIDVAETSYAAADVECLRMLGVTNGTSATTYSPSDVVTREQMAAFLGRLYREITGEACAPSGSSFADVSVSSFAATDVECLVSLGVTNGTSATTYSPGDVVTREQMAAFLGRLFRAITGD
ncbi:MAG: S8 family serine peptidase [Actinomycetota bacterium]